MDKPAIRKEAFARRKAQENKDDLSRAAVARFTSLPEYESATTVMWYVDARSELRTRHNLPAALDPSSPTGSKTVVVPWCNDEGELELFKLDAMDELELGMYSILEPKADLRSLPEKQVDVRTLDLIMVPGVGFDRQGGRTGHGKGYYDKLMQHARPDAPLVALCFECQLFDAIPMDDHDIFMDKIVTEAVVYDGKGR